MRLLLVIALSGALLPAVASAVNADNAPGDAAAVEKAGPSGTDIIIAISATALGIVLLALWRRRQRRDEPARRIFCPWGSEDLLLALAAFVLSIWVVGTIARAMVPGDVRVHPWRPSIVMGIGGALTCLLIFFHVRRRYGLLPRDIGLRFDTWPRDLLLAAGLLLVVIAARVPLGGFFEYLRQYTGAPREHQHIIEHMKIARSPVAVWAMIAVALVVAPVWEEVIFRAFIQPFLRRYTGGVASVVVTAVLFSLTHDPGSRFFRVPVLMFPLALALGYAYHRTQRLAAPLLLHVLHNAIPVVAILVQRTENT